MTGVAINLIPTRRLAAIARQRRLKWWTAALAIHALAMGLIWTTSVLVSGRSGAGELSARVERIALEVDQMQTKLRTSQPQLANLRRQVTAARAVSQQPDWSVLLAALASARGDQIVLQGCALAVDDPQDSQRRPGPVRAVSAVRKTKDPKEHQPGHYSLKIDGMSDNQMAVSQFMLDLESTGLFDRVRLLKTDRTTYLTRPAVSFTVQCALAG